MTQKNSQESLNFCLAMEEFRYYVVGSQFKALTDHEPLLSIYNNRQKPASRKICNHGDKVQYALPVGE